MIIECYNCGISLTHVVTILYSHVFSSLLGLYLIIMSCLIY